MEHAGRLRAASLTLSSNDDAHPQPNVDTNCLLETSFCTDSHDTQQNGEFSSGSDILIFFCLVPLQFPDARNFTGKKSLTAFSLFDYVALPFFIVTDTDRSIPNDIFNRILMTLAMWS